MKQKLMLFLLVLMSGCGSGGMSFTPGTLWYDNQGVHINAHGGGILKMGDTYYWYGEHKTAGQAGNVANVGVHCYSSKDLYSWKDRGIVLAVSDDPESPITKGCIIERPKVIYNEKNDRYVMWFHLELKGQGYTQALSGVATAESPTGPFTFLKAVRPNAGHWPINMPQELRDREIKGEGLVFDGGALPLHPDEMNLVGRDLARGQMARDMTLFVDEGKAYHIYSSEENSTLHIALLDDDYTSHTGIYTRNFAGRFMEAPAIFKYQGRYYLIMSGCTGWAPNAARMAVADEMLGEWTEIGNPCVGADAETTFHSQSTYVLPVEESGEYIYMGDRWCPSNAIDGRYIWLPLVFDEGVPKLEWKPEWSYRRRGQ